jgi:hypothetical protein
MKILQFQASSAMIAGLGVAVAGFSGRALVRAAPGMTTKLTELGKLLPKINVDVNIHFSTSMCLNLRFTHSQFLEVSTTKGVSIPRSITNCH